MHIIIVVLSTGDTVSMENIKKFLEGKDFENSESDIEPFPEGKTKLQLEKIMVENITIDYPDGPKERYILEHDGKKYWAGKQIMNGLKIAIEEKAKEVFVVRQGMDRNTKYMVVSIE